MPTCGLDIAEVRWGDSWGNGDGLGWRFGGRLEGAAEDCDFALCASDFHRDQAARGRKKEWGRQTLCGEILDQKKEKGNVSPHIIEGAGSRVQLDIPGW